MAINNALIKSILEKLNEVYPEYIEYDRDVLPEHEDRQEIKKHIAYCEGKGWVTFREVTARGTHGYMFIKIRAEGIDYLSTL